MKIKYNSEIISGGLFVIVAAVLYLLLPSQINTLEKSTVNAATMPRIAIVGLLICSVFLLIQGIFSEKKEVVIDSEFWSRENTKKELRSVLFAFILIVYGLLFQPIGYILDTLLLVTVILLYYHCRKVLYYVISCVTVILVYLVFTQLLNVNLPTLFL